MGAFAVGDVVLVPFPFSDLSQSKKRPALILAYAGREDWVCLQITSQRYDDQSAIAISEGHFAVGSLQRESFVRPSKLFTAHSSLFLRNLARMQNDKLAEVKEVVIDLIRKGTI